jgi:hypothetical protein
MVRFGNVLGAYGSVVPLFRQQLAAGGPITLTHPEIMRYFMTIPEVAQLVLLSGLSLRDAANPGGDIEIVCIGLRPGEKLHEELLIDAESEATAHPLIYRARERAVPPEKLWPQMMPWRRQLSGRMWKRRWRCWRSWCRSGGVARRLRRERDVQRCWARRSEASRSSSQLATYALPGCLGFFVIDPRLAARPPASPPGGIVLSRWKHFQPG